VYINPVIVKKKGRVTNHGEGCLSLPGKFYEVKRFKSVVMECLDRDGQFQTVKSAYKNQAFCFQHEVDHLNGLTLEETSK
jgi:peptide deformylase